MARINFTSQVLQFDSSAMAAGASPAITADSGHKIRTVFQDKGVVRHSPTVSS